MQWSSSAYFWGRLRLLNVAHDVDDEVARAHKGVDDVDILIGKRTPKFLLEDVLNRIDHEVDNGLGGVDNAVDIGGLDRKALEELFVNGVEKCLFLREIVDGGSGQLDGAVETVERFEEIRCD